MKSFKDFLEDVRKMPGGGYGVYADKFKNKRRVMTPGGKHAKELKKVYKNKNLNHWDFMIRGPLHKIVRTPTYSHSTVYYNFKERN